MPAPFVDATPAPFVEASPAPFVDSKPSNPASVAPKQNLNAISSPEIEAQKRKVALLER